MGQAKRRRELYPDTYGTPACPGAGVRKVRGRPLPKRYRVAEFPDGRKQESVFRPGSTDRQPFDIGRNAAKRADKGEK